MQIAKLRHKAEEVDNAIDDVANLHHTALFSKEVKSPLDILPTEENSGNNETENTPEK